MTIFYGRSWQTSIKHQVVNILGFVGHTVSVTTIQLQPQTTGECMSMSMLHKTLAFVGSQSCTHLLFYSFLQASRALQLLNLNLLRFTAFKAYSNIYHAILILPQWVDFSLVLLMKKLILIHFKSLAQGHQVTKRKHKHEATCSDFIGAISVMWIFLSVQIL